MHFDGFQLLLKGLLLLGLHFLNNVLRHFLVSVEFQGFSVHISLFLVPSDFNFVHLSQIFLLLDYGTLYRL